MQTALPENLAEMFEYLDELRESGETNMFGAPPYVQSEFGVGKDEAIRVCSAWMRTFTRDTSPEDRAAGAIASFGDKGMPNFSADKEV